MMRALCVVLVVLVAVKADDDGAKHDELQQQSEKEVDEGVVRGEDGVGSSDENADSQPKKSETDINNVDEKGCGKYDGLDKAVAKVIGDDKDNVKAKLEGVNCSCTQMAVELLGGSWPEDIFYTKPFAYTKIKNESDEDIAQKLWNSTEGVMSDVLYFAIGEEGVKLEYGCAKNSSMAVCTFAPPQEDLEKFKEKAKALWSEILQ